jgi:hypothetical protein
MEQEQQFLAALTSVATLRQEGPRLELRRAEGINVQDSEGRWFIDCLAGAGTLALGHNHPVVLQAIRGLLDGKRPLHTLDLMTEAKDEFIKEKCKNGVLMYKDLPVKTEMADHVYNEIKFDKSVKCNPCDRTCDYNIVEAKMKTQEALTPKFSKDLKI